MDENKGLRCKIKGSEVWKQTSGWFEPSDHKSRDARKIGLRGFRPGSTQTSLYSHRIKLES